ncbi:MAG: DUF1549 domain-containing protein [Planctomycetes bacterium]|nr:DUF1549 domain-containing protein [Planctomycetota bacterium]
MHPTPVFIGAALIAALLVATASSHGTPRIEVEVMEHPGVDRTLAKVQPLSADEIVHASRRIDELIAADLAKHDLKPNPRTTDAQFLRRAYLDIVGRIPTFSETNAFLTSTKADKRHELIATLMGSAGYVSHQFNYWADLLRVSTRMMDRYPGQPYIDWIKEALRTNKPYDTFVSELLRAEGPALQRGNGATGYYLRDTGMPLDNMANTVRTFLGTQITCAQCHDHPTDKWTRRDFCAMAAYTSSTNVDRKVGNPRELKKAMDGREASQELKNALRTLSYTIALKVRGGNKSTLALPADYQYTDGKPGQPVKAKTMFGDDAPVAAKQDPRETYAAWMTSPENPRFTLVIANRMWKKVMGRGLIEPVDALTDETKPTNPELMDFLTRLMIGVTYDLRRFQLALYQTEAYQRSVTTNDIDPGEPYRFQGPLLHRMSAEQLWDSLLTLKLADVDTKAGLTAEPLFALYDENKDKSMAELVQLATDMTEAKQKAAELQKRYREMRSRLANAKPDERKALVIELKALDDERKALTTEFGMFAYAKKIGGKPGKGQKFAPEQLVRASELPSPAPSGHLLATFGQSDRELIDNATTDPAVTQALTLLNGFVDRELINTKSTLYTSMMTSPDEPGRIRALFLCILSRPPTAAELQTAIAYAGTAGKDAHGDIAWALINSDEFRFVQ